MKTFLKDKKGESNGIFFVILSITFIISISGFMDLTSILQKYNCISTTMTYLSRIAAEQGGFRDTPPEYYRERYITKAEMREEITTSFRLAGIEDDQWELYILTESTDKSLGTTYDNGALQLSAFDTATYGNTGLPEFITTLENIVISKETESDAEGNGGGEKVVYNKYYNEYNLKSNTPIETVDWGKQMAFKLVVGYDWSLLSNFIPANNIHDTISSVRFMNSAITIQDGYDSDNKDGINNNDKEDIKIIY